MRHPSIYYCEPVFRPPSEAYSLLIQVTEGCTHACTFCISNIGKKFKIRDLAEIKQDIANAHQIYGDVVTRIFFLDGNAFAAKPDLLIELTKNCYNTFPKLERVSAYAHAKDVLQKSDAELKAIATAGLDLLYLGIETGDDDLLKGINKQTTADELARAAQKMHLAGITLSGTIILGLAGNDPVLSRNHAIATGQLINRMAPPDNRVWYMSALTLMLAPGSILTQQAQKGQFHPADSQESLMELKIMLENTTDSLQNCIFRSNHASNYLPLKGTLAQDKKKLLDLIDWGLKNPSGLRPEFYRGL